MDQSTKEQPAVSDIAIQKPLQGWRLLGVLSRWGDFPEQPELLETPGRDLILFFQSWIRSITSYHRDFYHCYRPRPYRRILQRFRYCQFIQPPILVPSKLICR